MDAQRFIAEFRHIVSAPNGVPKLRELVLVLAMQGRLVPQASGETASELLDRIDVEKSSIGKHSSKLPELAVTGASNPIPANWAWVRFGDIAIHNSGKTLDSVRNSGQPRDYITTSNLYWGRFDLGNLRRMLIRDEELERCTARKNDLLICEGGEAGRAAVWTSETEVCFQNHIHRARFFGSIDPFFAYRFFEKLNATGEINDHRKGMGISNLSSKSLAMIPFPLPPTEEQSRIVAKVDELMALCDRLEAQQQSRRQLQTALRRATLQALASTTSPAELHTAWTRLADNFGQLFSAPEDVDELRSLCVELAIRGELVSSDAAPTEDNSRSSLADEPFPIPKSWRWIRFDDLLRNSESGWSPKCDAEPRKPGEWGVLKVSAVTWGEFRPQENKRLPPSLEPRPEAEVKPGDFLLSRANTAELVARSVVVPDDVPEKLLMSDKIIRLNFADPERKAWANLVNNSLYARDYYRRNATGTSASMRNVSRQVIHGLPIPLPPKPAQQATLEKLTRLQRWYNLLEQQLRDARKLAERVATAAVSSLTGIAIEQEEAPVKASKTELFAPLHLGKSPNLQAGARDDKPRRGTFVGGALVRVRSQ
ncbi:MAG: restriction endonuclease subunit S [Gammaproteobacteria bacterium]|nr:restriction endonuclease subunit S [Gammaproteobacteria bacterium]